MEFSTTFMGHVGFDELKKHCRHGDEFCKEILSVFSERATLELAYSKSLKRFSQRLSKACSNQMCSPLTTAWRTIYTEMDKEAELHRKYSANIQEECVKPTGVLVESQSKIRKSMEAGVESASKFMSDKLLDHSKHKKRHHQLSKEYETLCDLVEGSRPKTEKDQIKLVTKQKKTEETLARSNDDYYESLLEVQRKQLDWENVSRESCSKIQNLEQAKLDHICRLAMSYSSLISNMTQQLEQSCQQMKSTCSSLDPDGEIRILLESRRGTKYQTEQILCDYYGENFSNRIKQERRIASLNKALGKFLGDLQKERAHYDGMHRIKSATADRATVENISDVNQEMMKATFLITYLDVNRNKLQKAVATANGTSVEPHPLAIHIEQRFDKQGIMHSTLKIPPETKVDDVEQHEEFRNNSPPGPGLDSPATRQRTQSERLKMSPIGNGNSEPINSRRGGTLSAKQMRDLGDGLSKMRKQAPAPPTPKVATCKCLVKFRYESRQPDELTIEEGDVITVQEKDDADWWKGEINGKVGIFPATYVDILQ